MAEHKPYDPLDYRNLTVNLVRELMRQPALDLPLAQRFAGPGVYALFYNGDYELYGSLCSPDASEPIYVGKADPPKPKRGQLPDDSKPKLYRRIHEHTRSLERAENLKLGHFRCRYLVVVPLWIKMAEQFLVDHYAPCWNVCISGFGIHDPGGGRRQGLRSFWDTLHPGRPWGPELQPRSEEDVRQRLRAFVAEQGPTPETP